MSENGTYIGCRVTDKFKDQVTQAAKYLGYLNDSDFIRNAVRDTIKREAPHVLKE